MISVVISAVFHFYLDGKVIVVKFDTIVYYSLAYNHFSALNPDSSFVWSEIVHDILVYYYLADGTIMYDVILCTNVVIKGELLYATEIGWCCLFS